MFSVACFWCQNFGDDSPYMRSYHFGSALVAEWPPFGKYLLTRLTICSLLYLDCLQYYLFPTLVLRAGFGF